MLAPSTFLVSFSSPKATKMHLAHIIPLLAGVAAALPSAGHLNRKDDPSPPEIQLINFVYSGSGCTAGAVSAKTSADKSKLTLEYDRFVAEAGRNISIARSRRNCQINFRFKLPVGWQFSVARAEYLGYAQIPAGLTGLTKSTYYFSGERAQVQNLSWQSNRNYALSQSVHVTDDLSRNLGFFQRDHQGAVR